MKTSRKFLAALLIGLLLATTALCSCGSPMNGAASPSNLQVTPPPASPSELQPVPAPAPADPQPTPAPDPAPAPEAPKSEETISEADAKAKVLEKVPGATLDNFREFHMDRDDGRLEYEGSLVYDKMEYEFEIDAKSGKFTSWDKDSIYD